MASGLRRGGGGGLLTGTHTSFPLPSQTDTEERFKGRLLCADLAPGTEKTTAGCNLLALSCLSPTGEAVVKTLLPANICDFILVSQTIQRKPLMKGTKRLSHFHPSVEVV